MKIKTEHIADPALGEVCQHCVEQLAIQMSEEELAETMWVLFKSFESVEDPDEMILIGRELDLTIHAHRRLKESENYNV